jgi:hypothetical protein
MTTEPQSISDTPILDAINRTHTVRAQTKGATTQAPQANAIPNNLWESLGPHIQAGEPKYVSLAGMIQDIVRFAKSLGLEKSDLQFGTDGTDEYFEVITKKGLALFATISYTPIDTAWHTKFAGHRLREAASAFDLGPPVPCTVCGKAHNTVHTRDLAKAQGNPRPADPLEQLLRILKDM